MSALPSSHDLLGAVLVELGAVRAEVQALRGELAELREAVARRPADTDEADERLLEAINFEIGELEFSCVSLLEHTQLDAAADLRLALEKFFGCTPSPKRLGKWLSKMHGCGNVRRCVVDHRQDDGHRGGTWSVRMTRI